MENETTEVCPGIVLEGDCIRIDLSLYFSNSEAIPADVFADSVNGMSHLVHEAQNAFTSLLGIDRPQKTAVYLNTVRNGSKLTDFVFRVFLGSDEEASRTADVLHQRFGINELVESKHIQNIVIVAIVAFLLRDVACTYMSRENSVPAIEATNSIILNAGRDLNMESSELERILSESIRNTKRASKDAVMAIQPAQMKPDTLVKVGGHDGIEIPRAIVSKLPPPSAIDTKEPPSRIDLSGMKLSVLAMDIDRKKTGWAVSLPKDSICGDRRLRAILDDSVSQADLMYHPSVTADISVYLSPSGKPDHVLIRSIHPDIQQ